MIIQSSPTVLLVDDDPSALRWLVMQLKDQAYRIITAKNGKKALTLLQASPEKYDVVVLDRKMPGMTGMEVLAKMKTDERLNMVPVIFQTAMADEKDILEGFQAGVDYYLTKPCKREILLAVIKTALSGYNVYKSIREDARERTDALALMKTGYFEFQSIEEGKKLATLLASVCPDPEKVVIGLWELLLNAIEHGNLGITYEEKSQFIEKDEWLDEVERRMRMKKNLKKKVMVQFEHLDCEIRFLIRDQGRGFNWQSFIELRPERAFDTHGRGIVVAQKISFDRVEYSGIGNEVLAVIYR